MADEDKKSDFFDDDEPGKDNENVWKEKYFSARESLNDLQGEVDERKELTVKILSNLIILAKDDEAEESPTNSTLKKVKETMTKELLLDELKRALSILQDFIFSSDAPPEPEKSEESIEAPAADTSIDPKLVVDIFLNITSKLKVLLKGDLKREVESLEKEASATGEIGTIKRLASDLSNIILSYNDVLINEKRGVETFLKELIANLAETEKSLIDTLGTQSVIFKSNSDFNDEINNEVKSISKSFDVSKTIEEIKKRVFEKIHSIGERIKKKRESDNESKKMLQVKINKMQTKLVKLKKEATYIKKRSKKIEKVATIDPLTKALNRRGFEKKMQEELERLKRYKSPSSLIMLDLDNFKSVNDKYGHAAGDKVLVKISELINRDIRKNDALGRYGGEEFVVILPNNELERAMKTAEKIRVAVSGLKFLFQDERVVVTLSGGVTELKDDDTIEAIYSRADNSLYKAKNAGKNCIRY